MDEQDPELWWTYVCEADKKDIEFVNIDDHYKEY